MTYTEISQMLASIGIPYAYYQFPDGTDVAPPFVCFFYDSDNDFKADGINYAKIRGLNIELYTDDKDFDLENAIETALNEHGLVYSRDETYLGSERMNMVNYYTEVIIDGE